MLEAIASRSFLYFSVSLWIALEFGKVGLLQTESLLGFLGERFGENVEKGYFL